MSYRYEFDDTRDGDLRLRRTSYEILQDAYRGLRDELEAWNRRPSNAAARRRRTNRRSSDGIDRVVDDLSRAIAAGTTTIATR